MGRVTETRKYLVNTLYFKIGWSMAMIRDATRLSDMQIRYVVDKFGAGYAEEARPDTNHQMTMAALKYLHQHRESKDDRVIMVVNILKGWDTIIELRGTITGMFHQYDLLSNGWRFRLPPIYRALLDEIEGPRPEVTRHGSLYYAAWVEIVDRGWDDFLERSASHSELQMALAETHSLLHNSDIADNIVIDEEGACDATVAAIDAAIGTMDPDHKEIFIHLRGWANVPRMTAEYLADEMRVSTESIRTAYAAAYQHLRRHVHAPYRRYTVGWLKGETHRLRELAREAAWNADVERYGNINYQAYQDLSRSLEELELPVTAVQKLVQALPEITYVWELCQHTEAQLIQMDGIGPDTVNKLKQALQPYRLSFGTVPNTALRMKLPPPLSSYRSL